MSPGRTLRDLRAHLEAAMRVLEHLEVQEQPVWEVAIAELRMDSVDESACERWAHYRREAKMKPWTKATWKASLKKHGEAFPEVVEQSIANGWQGLFAVKVTDKAKATDAIDREFQALKGRRNG